MHCELRRTVVIASTLIGLATALCVVAPAASAEDLCDIDRVQPSCTAIASLIALVTTYCVHTHPSAGPVITEPVTINKPPMPYISHC